MKEVYKISEVNLPLIPLRGYWVMPTTMLNFDSSRSISKNAVENAKLNNEELFLVNQLDIFDDNPKEDGLYEVGIVAEIKETFPLPNGDIRVFVQATGLGKVKKLHVAEGFLRCEIEKYEYIEENEEKTDELEALRKLLVKDFRSYANINDDIMDEIAYGMTELENYHRLVDLICYHLDLAPKEYYEVLSSFDAKERMELVHRIINKEIELKNLGAEIEKEVTENINQSQKEYYLREKMDVLKKELASTTGQGENEVDELRKKIKKIKFDKESRKSLEKDLDRLDTIPEMSPDYGVISSYLDFVVGLPWNKKSDRKSVV